MFFNYHEMEEAISRIVQDCAQIKYYKSEEGAEKDKQSRVNDLGFFYQCFRKIAHAVNGYDEKQKYSNHYIRVNEKTDKDSDGNNKKTEKVL